MRRMRGAWRRALTVAAVAWVGESAMAEGLRIPEGWDDSARFDTSKIVPVAALPSTFDWRVQAGGLPPVNTQASGDCWAQGTVGVLESLLKIHGENVRISVQQVISCSGAGSARRGGFFAHEYHRVTGAVTTPEYPYTGRDTACKRGLSPTYFLARWGYVGAKGRNPTTTEIKQAILEHGPVGTTITANAALQRFRGDGVFRGCSRARTNHIEVIVGWDDAEGVWFVRNSWGPSHGKDGYAKIPYGCSRVGEIATYADLNVAGVGYVPAIELID